MKKVSHNLNIRFPKEPEKNKDINVLPIIISNCSPITLFWLQKTCTYRELSHRAKTGGMILEDLNEARTKKKIQR